MTSPMRTIDDRYRINQKTGNISEALHYVAREYGYEMDVDEQVAVVRALRAKLDARSGPLTRRDVLEPFERFEMRRPRNGFASDVIARLERLDR